MPRRRAGTLIPIETEILRAAADLDEDERLHGFGLAESMAARGGRALVAHGTLYKALGRLLDAGLLAAEWEDPAIAEAARRPRRRLYAVTAEGRLALAAQPASAAAPAARLRIGEAGA